jgi:tetratricopeptide (TPR) repeat protein
MLEVYRYHAGKFPVNFSVFELVGSDVTSFLQNQSTLDFVELKEQEFHLISFLDPQGRVDFYSWVLKSKNSAHLLVPRQLKSRAFARLEKYLISEDVTILDIGDEIWTFVLGPDSKKYDQPDFFRGILLEESAFLARNDHVNFPEIIPLDQMEMWRILNGWPDFNGGEFSHEIINNLRLFDLSVTPNKGCYPGQETVSKIATRRGAAYAPVLLETKSPQMPGLLFLFEKKIGQIEHCIVWKNRFFSASNLLRDFRVSGMNLRYTVDQKEHEGVVTYYPLLSGKSEDKALDLFYEACDYFKIDQFEKAEANFKLALSLNPLFADCYETLGVMLGRQERYHEAIELMNQLTAVDSTSVLAHTNKSLFLMKIGLIEEAEKEKSLATIKSFQKFGDEAKLKERFIKEQEAQEREWNKRESMFKQVLEIDEEDTLANFGLGSILVEKKQWSLAVPFLEKVLQVDPHYSVAYLALGKAYKGIGEIDKAHNIWKEGILVAAKKGDLMPANQMQFEVQNI